jgi:hypothetical protein
MVLKMVYLMRGAKALTFGVGAMSVLWALYLLYFGVGPSTEIIKIIGGIGTVVVIGYGCSSLEK